MLEEKELGSAGKDSVDPANAKANDSDEDNEVSTINFTLK